MTEGWTADALREAAGVGTYREAAEQFEQAAATCDGRGDGVNAAKNRDAAVMLWAASFEADSEFLPRRGGVW